MSPAFVKLSLMFVVGLSLGLVVPWGYGPAKPANDGRNPGDRTVTVRCIVEHRVAGAAPTGFVGGKLPPIDAPMPIPIRALPPVEVRMPNTGKEPSGSEDIIFNFYVCPWCNPVEAGNPGQRERQMPDAM